MNMSAPFLQELAPEAATTRRVLERVPESSLAWRPHAKSKSLGQLALHVATLPQQLSDFVAGDTLDFSAAAGAPPSAANHGALMAAFDESVAHAQRYLESLSDARAMATWTLTNGVTSLFSAPRIGVIRSFLFNHWYHHRGQLVVSCDYSMCRCPLCTGRRPTRIRSAASPSWWAAACAAAFRTRT